MFLGHIILPPNCTNSGKFPSLPLGDCPFEEPAQSHGCREMISRHFILDESMPAMISAHT
jgi:hypothetical protein